MTTQVMQEVEDGDVNFFLSVSSTLDALLRRMDRDPILDNARVTILLPNSPFCAYLQRAEALYAKTVPAGYLHPDDVALCAYLNLLYRHPNPAVREFIHRVAQENRSDFRWLPHVARLYAEYRPKYSVFMLSDDKTESVERPSLEIDDDRDRLVA